jgi:hypothetical protein
MLGWGHMPSILSRSEYASLEKIVQHPRLATDLPQDHVEKLINYGLVKKDILLLHVTARGQVEIFRQRFKGVHQIA